MNPCIQIVHKDGKTTFMRGAGENGEVFIYGCQPQLLLVCISDMKGRELTFRFSPKCVGRIIAHAITEDITILVEKLCEDKKLFELIEDQELSCKNNEDTVEMFLNNAFGTNKNYIYRLEEKDNDKWVLSFVFYDEEVSSLPIKCEFSY